MKIQVPGLALHDNAAKCLIVNKAAAFQNSIITMSYECEAFILLRDWMGCDFKVQLNYYCHAGTW